MSNPWLNDTSEPKNMSLSIPYLSKLTDCSVTFCLPMFLFAYRRMRKNSSGVLWSRIMGLPAQMVSRFREPYATGICSAHPSAFMFAVILRQSDDLGYFTPTSKPLDTDSRRKLKFPTTI
ncbi:hypothetical protein PM082_023975 [Marasmius tenuissimus]|nr:hypothetical protein PM082_023975 [Marasmius tenuissimus]